MSKHLKEEHEAFKARLIDEVLGEGAVASDKVPMEKVVMIIWQFRDDPQVVKFMTRFVAKVRIPRVHFLCRPSSANYRRGGIFRSSILYSLLVVCFARDSSSSSLAPATSLPVSNFTFRNWRT